MKKLVLLILLQLSLSASSQKLQVLCIGDFTTAGGGIIKNCSIGYCTLGRMNEDRTNIIVWPAWYGGTSKDLYKFAPSVLDTSEYYIIMTDPPGDGISSSPSNYHGFPEITIADMVRAQHILLTRKLKIDHVYCLFGISMGGMQVFEWVNEYPSFAKYGVPVVGTPAFTSFDYLFWTTCRNILLDGKRNHEENEALRRLTEICHLHFFTPSWWVRNHKPEDIPELLNSWYEDSGNIDDRLSVISALLTQNIYREKRKVETSTKMLVMASPMDEIVNPLPSIDYSKENGTPIILFQDDLGHFSPFLKPDQVKSAVSNFLSGK